MLELVVAIAFTGIVLWLVAPRPARPGTREEREGAGGRPPAGDPGSAVAAGGELGRPRSSRVFDWSDEAHNRGTLDGVVVDLHEAARRRGRR